LVVPALLGVKSTQSVYRFNYENSLFLYFTHVVNSVGLCVYLLQCLGQGGCAEAQEEFKDALEQFGSVVELQNTDLKQAYDKLNSEYENSEDAAEMVTDRINSVESVAEALFKEWEGEIDQYTNADFKRSSSSQLRQTRTRYTEMLATMRRSEQSMQPVLRTFRDNVLFLKHNLNAQAIGSLRGEFASLEDDILALTKLAV